jgi:hypothetical protein
MSLFGWVCGMFVMLVWVEYDGSLVDDSARWLEKKLKEKNGW